MANRNMTSGLLTEVAKQEVEMFSLIKMGFATPQYLTDAYKNVTAGGNSYLASGNLLSISSITEETVLTVGSMSVSFSGVNQANISVALTENYVDEVVQWQMGFFDSSGTSVIDPVLLFDGRIENFSLSEDPESGVSTITWSVASHMSDFKKVAGRRTNTKDQEIYFPGDLGLNFASEIITDLQWGKP